MDERIMAEAIIIEPYGFGADIAFWPVILLLIMCVWRFRASRIVAVGCAALALALSVMAFNYIVVFGMTSLSVLHDWEVAISIGGAMLLIMGVALVQEITIGRWKTDRALGLFAIGMGLVGLVAIVWGIAIPVKDLVLPFSTVEGTITLLETQGRRPVNNIVRIGNFEVQASTGLFGTLHLGQHVRADISGGSDFIRRLERNLAP